MTDKELLTAIADAMEQKLRPIEERMDKLEEKITGIEARLEEKVSRVEIHMEEEIFEVREYLENKITEIKTHLENVTNKNIQTIAEGHLDLNRKLDDALKIEREKEFLVIRVRILEEELQKVKEQITRIA